MGNLGSLRDAWKKRPLLVVLILILLVLIGVLILILVLQAFRAGPAQPAPATATEVAATATVARTSTAPAGATATATQVLGGGATATATTATTEAETTPAPGRTTTPTATRPTGPAATATPAATLGPTAAVPPTVAPERANLLRNGSFEFGFDQTGLALNWQSFTNGSASVAFAAEQWPPAILDGSHAQRITVRDAGQNNRYAGIQQTVTVAPGAAYRLTLHGQIRIAEGSDQVGRYSYLLQLGLDQSGDDEWTFLPEEAWIDLPWDEQVIDGAGVKFQEYTTTVVPTTNRLTIFIRTWNKWRDPGQVQYTLDKLSLVGPVPAEALIDKPLPATGFGRPEFSVSGDPRLWASLVLLVLLVGGAIWRMRYGKV